VFPVGALLIAGSVVAGVCGKPTAGTTTIIAARQPARSTTPSSVTPARTGAPADGVAVVGAPTASRDAEDNSGHADDSSWDADDDQGVENDQGSGEGNFPDAPDAPSLTEGD